jgi:formate--tetrahydrofolate ligase
MEDINLFLTGDLHAVGAAHNLLSALVDNELHFRGPTNLDPRRVVWRRCVDMNDRALRRVIVGLGGTGDGVPREDGFDITAASEVMAILCLARDRADLKRRLGNVLVGWSTADEPVYARDLGAAGAMAALLREALMPNLVQTVEGGPALVHGGPFANIAHGASSLMATRLGLAYADFVVTEAGFASELGAEKFFHIKCRAGGLWPRAVVLVATCRALKLHGGVPKDAVERPDPAAVGRGLPNLAAHVENLRAFGFEPVVALNLFAGDAQEELAVVEGFCRKEGLACARADAFAGGGPGCEALAAAVAAAAASGPTEPRFLYDLALPPEEKIGVVARKLYGAGSVAFADRATADLARIRKLGLSQLPVCVAKTQGSLSDDPARLGRPSGFTLTVREVRPAAGAGFLVALTGPILTMPGLPREPAARSIDVDEDGKVSGLF